MTKTGEGMDLEKEVRDVPDVVILIGTEFILRNEGLRLRPDGIIGTPLALRRKIAGFIGRRP